MTFIARSQPLLLLLAASLPSLISGCGGSSETKITQPAAGATSSAGTGGSTTTSAGGTSAGSPSGGTAASTGGDAGASAVGGSAGSAGTAGTPSQVLGTLGTACTSPGALACAGTYQKLTLVCGGDGTWQTNQTCPSGQFCDSTPGPDVGTCASPIPECADKMPGDTMCLDGDIQACGPDNLTVVIDDDCDFGCVEGACFMPKQPGPDDDACPSDPGSLILNCSDQCTQTTPDCVTAACGETSETLLPVPTPAPGESYVVRTPSSPGSPCDCPSVAHSFQIVMDRADYPLSVSVAQPWLVHSDTGSEDACSDTGSQCRTLNPLAGELGVVLIFTTDPEAPARNVTVSAGDQCL